MEPTYFEPLIAYEDKGERAALLAQYSMRMIAYRWSNWIWVSRVHWEMRGSDRKERSKCGGQLHFHQRIVEHSYDWPLEVLTSVIQTLLFYRCPNDEQQSTMIFYLTINFSLAASITFPKRFAKCSIILSSCTLGQLKIWLIQPHPNYITN